MCSSSKTASIPVKNDQNLPRNHQIHEKLPNGQIENYIEKWQLMNNKVIVIKLH